MGRLLHAWFAPLQVFNRGLWNVLLNLGGAVILGGLAWLASKLGIAAGIAVVLLALLVVGLAALWQAMPWPALELRFDPATVQMPVALDHGVKVADARYFHFTVHSKTKVRDCGGRLILVERENLAGGYDVAPEYKPPYDLTLDSVPGLKWSLIEPDVPARINLVFSQSNQLGVGLCVPSHEASGNLTTLLPGKYRLSVRVSAEGVEDVEGRFLVQVTGAWNGLDVAEEP